ncbi:MAG TPA: 50S ribosomal protein L9 [Candidatus Peribacter riflensis]|uniref:Large ribosomal subunit protein bL9 n=1 Tax=Candidatus Peribacter riflensis TaxID=1735162 RepID=A0A0S1SKV6_9BACT|nr:MAG: large subunit ribosomal protein L9 [Candidatus Peribacter riflensis]OGJ76742.1 MAG: 50S ribosomal protein L9 [Candidatus Peribacteria bacterium RIFOXYB1_FULL_57_12]OGJ82342.1 MAG: 50S ribosomal protein L9 [Candidatus Peribacteria bacterium RIFOXYC1_FULL_58_8]ALM10895.1 MAG: large subunit ribosomal protein L9 [Candidatus Peribacter riflensis]ALM11998.1 MAG: large subunit ribosomal protein L9 [Candidatus Peribacter riflensis]
MEILLLQDVPGIGKKNDLLIVGDGLALNCLLPDRRALVATPTVRRRYAEEIKRRAEEKQREMALRSSVAGKVTGKELVFHRKVTKTGKLYAAITQKHIAEALQEQLQVAADEAAIDLAEHIKSTGTFEAALKAGEFVQKFNVKVVAEK